MVDAETSTKRSATLQHVGVPARSPESYRTIVRDGVLDEINSLARDLRGLRLLHINATATGGGVAELLNSLVPLELGCGLRAEWRLLCPADALFRITKGLHNALQGEHWSLDETARSTFLTHSELCAETLSPADYDVIIVHDPQPVALRSFHRPDGTRWIWRCHVDSSSPDPAVWQFLLPYVKQYDATVVTRTTFVPPGLEGPSLHVVLPAIDPISPKNRALPRYLCRDEVAGFGIDLARPLVIQVARFDRWKDPLGALAAYRIVKEELPETQFALIGAMVQDDPEGWEMYERVRSVAEGDPNIRILSNLTGIGAHEVNAFQRVADVVVQKSVREGFGLAVSESVWKGTPVVGGNAGGIPLQIRDGVGGFLADSVEECAERVLFLLTHPEQAEQIARRGWGHIRDQFLMPRLLRDELALLQSATHADRRSVQPSPLTTLRRWLVGGR